MKEVYQVLIVEDDPMVAMINEQYLRRSRRFAVAGKCGDGRSALAFLEKQPVDLVIMDVFMPQLGGIETLQAIREHGWPVDVIMVTAANDRATLEDALRLGAVDYLVKPFALDRFQAALDKFISHAEALKNVDVLSQQNIDFIIANARRNAEAAEAQHPKGIQEKTLTLIMDYMKGTGGKRLTGDAIAEAVGLSAVTVRRYMNYLAETGEVEADMDYETGGRPSMLYRAAEK